MKANSLRPRGSIPAQAVPALLILAKLAIFGGANSDDPYRNPERVNGVWATSMTARTTAAITAACRKDKEHLRCSLD